MQKYSQIHGKNRSQKFGKAQSLTAPLPSSSSFGLEERENSKFKDIIVKNKKQKVPQMRYSGIFNI